MKHNIFLSLKIQICSPMFSSYKETSAEVTWFVQKRRLRGDHSCLQLPQEEEEGALISPL